MICPKCKAETHAKTPEGAYFCYPCQKDFRPLMACGPKQGRRAVLGQGDTDGPVGPEDASACHVVANRSNVSDGEALFAEEWNSRHPEYPFETEYKFFPFREWRLDFAWPDVRVAVEIESSVHRTKERFGTDLPKYNALAMEGWQLFRFTLKMLEDDARRLLALPYTAISRRKAELSLT